MSDDERREAERLAKETFEHWNGVTGVFPFYSAYVGEVQSLMVDMYAAGAESMVADSNRYFRAQREKVEAERARSARLLGAAKAFVRSPSEPIEPLQKAITEFEAGK